MEGGVSCMLGGIRLKLWQELLKDKSYYFRDVTVDL